MRLFSLLLGCIVSAVALTSCGGGGGSANQGAVAVAASLTLELRDSNGVLTNVVSASGTTMRATVRDTQGAAVKDTLVTFTGDAALVSFLPASGVVLTDAAGVATVQVSPASNTASGAGRLSASAMAGTAAVNGALNFQISASQAPVTASASLALELRDSNALSTNVVSAAGTTLRATLRDASGAAVKDALVTFTGDSTLVTFSPPSGVVLTDAAGVAVVQVSPASISASGAGRLAASATAGTTAVVGGLNFQFSTSQGPVTASASLTLELRDTNGVATNVVSGSGSTLRAIIRDGSGAAVKDALVVFSGDASLVAFSPSSGVALSDATGVANVQVSGASTSASGAGRLTASVTAGDIVLNGGLNYQLTASNVALSALDVGSTPLAAFASRPISVLATVNGSPATTVPVQVAFQASCGTVSPATAVTDSTGKAATTYSASAVACAGGNVSITASASGASPLQGVLTVLAPTATNMQFVSATPQLMYLRNSVGATQSQLVFRVVDANGIPLSNQGVQLSLVTNSQTGVSIGTQGNSATVSLSSNASGDVSVAVFAGTVPTSVQVRAVLSSNTNVEATSNQLTVASGRPVQRAASFGVKTFAIEGFTLDGVTTEVTMRLADRQGNPVPDGTQINFTSEAGVLLPPSCIVSAGESGCTVMIRTQGTRPADGKVTVLAYVPGEEDFVDANANNAYDLGEAFTDLGNAYRDDNANISFDIGEFSVPRAGAIACGFAPDQGRANTCDGVWGAVDVRKQLDVIFSTRRSVATFSGTANSLNVRLADENGNSLAAESTIEVTQPDANSTCAGVSSHQAIPNQLEPANITVSLTGCASGNSIVVKITSAVSKTITEHALIVP